MVHCLNILFDIVVLFEFHDSGSLSVWILLKMTRKGKLKGKGDSKVKEKSSVCLVDQLSFSPFIVQFFPFAMPLSLDLVHPRCFLCSVCSLCLWLSSFLASWVDLIFSVVPHFLYFSNCYISELLILACSLHTFSRFFFIPYFDFCILFPLSGSVSASVYLHAHARDADDLKRVLEQKEEECVTLQQKLQQNKAVIASLQKQIQEQAVQIKTLCDAQLKWWSDLNFLFMFCKIVFIFYNFYKFSFPCDDCVSWSVNHEMKSESGHS